MISIAKLIQINIHVVVYVECDCKCFLVSIFKINFIFFVKVNHPLVLFGVPNTPLNRDVINVIISFIFNLHVNFNFLKWEPFIILSEGIILHSIISAGAVTVTVSVCANGSASPVTSGVYEPVYVPVT